MQPATPSILLDYLANLGIKTETVEHEAAFTVEDSRLLTGNLPGVHVKNLFLCDSKKKMWLITAPSDVAINLRALSEVIGSKRLSFGSPMRLLRTLGVAPGSVSPFCVINDSYQEVQVVLDAWMMKQEQINAHPLINTKTTTIKANDLLTFFQACGHKPLIVDLVHGTS